MLSESLPHHGDNRKGPIDFLNVPKEALPPLMKPTSVNETFWKVFSGGLQMPQPLFGKGMLLSFHLRTQDCFRNLETSEAHPKLAPLKHNMLQWFSWTGDVFLRVLLEMRK